MNNTIQRKKLVADTLIKIGADPACKGFRILRDAVLEYMEYDIPANVQQQDVLALIGNKYGMSWKNAYRNVRTLIGNIMLHEDTEFLESYFGRCYRAENGTVRPKAFIIRIADDVKMQCEELSKIGGANISDERKQVIEEIVKEIESISNIVRIRSILGIVRSFKKIT